MDHCKKLEALLTEEKIIIRRHIIKHKYYQCIEDIDSAVADFIDKYGFVMREIFCDQVCQENKTCETYQNYLKNNKEIEYIDL